MAKTQIMFAVLVCMLLPSALVFAGTSGPSPIPPAASFQISTNTTTLCKGVTNYVPILVRAAPGSPTMLSTQLGLSGSRYASMIGSDTVIVGNVTANHTVTAIMPIFVSFNSTPIISADISINYQYLLLYTDNEARNVSFSTETCPSSLAVNVSPAILTSGKIQNVTLKMSNDGPSTLNRLTIHASLPSQDGTFLTLQPVQVSSISAGGHVDVKERLFVYSNASQSFPINISVSFYNGTSLEQLSTNPVLLSSGIINITPSSTTLSPSEPSSGSIFSISFVLTNIGTTKASAVTATLLPPQGFSPYGAPSTFVGDMAVDSQTPVTLTLSSTSGIKAGNYTIPVRMNYLDTLRRNLSTTIYVPVHIGGAFAFNSTSTGSAVRVRRSGSGLVVIVLALGVIAMSVLYLLERKRHKRLKEEHKKLKALHGAK